MQKKDTEFEPKGPKKYVDFIFTHCTDNQKIEVREYCERMVWEIVKEYEDEGLPGTLYRNKRS